MTVPGIVGLRVSRNAPLVLARWDGPPVERGEPVLAEIAGSKSLAFVVLTSSDLLTPLPSTPTARVLAGGRHDPAVAAAISARDSVAREELQKLLGLPAAATSVHWSADLGELTVRLSRGVLSDPEETKRRVMERFRAAVRIERV